MMIPKNQMKYFKHNNSTVRMINICFYINWHKRNGPMTENEWMKVTHLNLEEI